MKAGNGGPAFPGEYEKYAPGEVGNNVPIKEHSSGMTLRDYFAAKVAAGDAATEEGWGTSPSDEILLARAKLYYRIADAMLAAREAA